MSKRAKINNRRITTPQSLNAFNGLSLEHVDETHMLSFSQVYEGLLQKMCETLFNYYDIKKEILPVLGMIVRRGGYVRLKDGRLTVQLMRFKDPDIDYAARHLCGDLNQMRPYTVDRFHLPIHYEVL